MKKVGIIVLVLMAIVCFLGMGTFAIETFRENDVESCEDCKLNAELIEKRITETILIERYI